MQDVESGKGAAGFRGVKLLLYENSVPPIEDAIAAAQAEAPRGNFRVSVMSCAANRSEGREEGR
jgi:hypothetical protein